MKDPRSYQSILIRYAASCGVTTAKKDRLRSGSRFWCKPNFICYRFLCNARVPVFLSHSTFQPETRESYSRVGTSQYMTNFFSQKYGWYYNRYHKQMISCNGFRSSFQTDMGLFNFSRHRKFQIFRQYYYFNFILDTRKTLSNRTYLHLSFRKFIPPAMLFCCRREMIKKR